MKDFCSSITVIPVAGTPILGIGSQKEENLSGLYSS